MVRPDVLGGEATVARPAKGVPRLLVLLKSLIFLLLFGNIGLGHWSFTPVGGQLGILCVWAGLSDCLARR